MRIVIGIIAIALFLYLCGIYAYCKAIKYFNKIFLNGGDLYSKKKKI